VKLYWHQLRGEQLLFWRTREAAIFVFLFPVLLLLLVGSVYTGKIEGRDAGDVLLVGMIGYGVANTAFSGLAITLVIRREGGVLKRLRATPLPTWTYFASLLSSTAITFALQGVALVLLARFAFGAQVPERLPVFVFACFLGTLAFAGVGLGTAALIRSGEGSSALVNLIVVPMAFLSGSFGSTENYPEALRRLGELLPLKHFVDLVDAVGLDGGSLWRPTDLAVLLAWGGAGVLVAARRFRWEPRAN
jgi:ABC-2 type transport system permease protein